MTDPAPQRRNERFTIEEAGEYVRLATSIEQHQQDGLSYDQLVDVAAEVGISEESLDAAIQQAQRERLQADTTDTPQWRAVADRCLEILCLKASSQTTAPPD